MRTATIIIFESGLSTPNQLFMSGAKAMIGMRSRRERQQEFASRHETRRQQRHDDAGCRPDGEPAERFDERRGR
jgi:hypothetical protein